MTPTVLSVTSNASAGSGSCSQSPSTNVTLRCSAAARSRRALAPLLQQVDRVVDAGRVGEPPGRGEGGVALSTRDIQGGLPGPYLGRLNEPFGDGLQRVAHPWVVAGLPAGPLALLDRFEVHS
jgi:hypothetical protein